MGKKRALIGVSNKEGIVEFAQNLEALGYEVIATGNSHKLLQENGIKSIEISNIINFPEILDGRVKTLHPKIHGGILAKRTDANHMQTLSEHNIDLIDIVCVNLYPFQEVLKRNASESELIENIDIGGPTLIRAAAKNFADVLVITSPSQYGGIIKELKEGEISLETRRNLMINAFEHTAAYDALIAQHFGGGFPEKLTLTFEKRQELRYGENPHQKGAFYIDAKAEPDFVQLHGKELSFNNINDLYGAVNLLDEFDEPACVAVKHATPCGVGIGEAVYEAFQKANKADPVSIFGGIVALNREVEADTAKEMANIFLEVIIAPSYSKEALEILTKKKNIRLLQINPKSQQKFDYKKTPNGLLLQTYDDIMINELLHITQTKPTPKQITDLIFANKVAKHLKSNAIAIAKNGQTIGLGGGQTSRIDALKKAIASANEHLGQEFLDGAALASDAFFPFGDCVELANSVGIKAIIQPGGSVRDSDSISLCDKYNIAMSFTGIRHFRH